MYMTVSEIEQLKDKHFALCNMYKYVADYKHDKLTNRELLGHVYGDAVARWNCHKFKFLDSWYRQDLLLSQRRDTVTLGVLADITALSVDTGPMYAFITIGWNEQTVTPAKMLNVSKNVMKLKYFSDVVMVLEKHRENGVHHHTHFLVKFEEKFPVSKILNWIYTTKGVKDICLGKNFIDYLGPQGKKPYQTYDLYRDYVSGKKKEAKLDYVKKDKVWRKENKIEDLYISEK